MIVTEKYVRKPLYVDVVQVTADNLVEIAQWCQGEIKNYSNQTLTADQAVNQLLERYIHVRVHNPKNARQTKAFVGDYLLYTERGYKVYTERAFKNSFVLVESDEQMIEDLGVDLSGVEAVPVPEVTPQEAMDADEDYDKGRTLPPETDLPNG